MRVAVVDVNGDGLLDFAVGGKSGLWLNNVVCLLAPSKRNQLLVTT
jgi:hypothetical protein